MENVEGRRRRRGRWLVLAALLAIVVWVVRSQRAARTEVGTGWPPPRPVDSRVPAPQPAAPRRPSPRPRPAQTR